MTGRGPCPGGGKGGALPVGGNKFVERESIALVEKWLRIYGREQARRQHGGPGEHPSRERGLATFWFVMHGVFLFGEPQKCVCDEWVFKPQRAQRS